MSETYGREGADVLRVESDQNPSDIGTKPLDAITFAKHLIYLGIMSIQNTRSGNRIGHKML